VIGSNGRREDYAVICARPCDLPLIGAIELAAAQLLAGHASDAALNEVTDLRELRSAQEQERLWVVINGDVPVGFAHADVLETGVAHLQEVDVHPDHGRRGLGAQLVATVCGWARASNFESIVLTTFRDVPWNMPFYLKLGYEVVPPDEWSATIRSIVSDEHRRGLDLARRVVMRRWCVD
jgi:GNAT superfamily N-acetyltransferase